MKKELSFKALSATTIMALFVVTMLCVTSPIKAHKKENLEQNQTEVLSKEASASLRSIVMPPQTSVPVVHSAILDKNMRKFATSEQYNNYISKFVNNAYNNNGSYLGAALIQSEIDRFSFYAFFTNGTDDMGKNVNPELTKKIKGFGDAFYKNITPYEEAINDWSDRYFNNLRSNLKFDHKPTANEVKERIDNYVANSDFTYSEKFTYNSIIDDYKEMIKGNSKIETDMNEIALKIYALDFVSIDKALYNAKIIGSSSDLFRDEKGKDVYSYMNRWLKSTAPFSK